MAFLVQAAMWLRKTGSGVSFEEAEDLAATWQDVEPQAFLKCHGFGLRTENGALPILAIIVPGHEEDDGSTWYKLECAIVQPDASRSEWRTRKRLAHLREILHDTVKLYIGDAKYDEYFAQTRFPGRGGWPGTTARLASWFSTLTRLISAGELSMHVTALALRFIDAPYIPSTIVACLDDQEGDVRRAAVKTLVKIVEKGDEQPISKLLERLEDPDSKVRQAVIEALAKVAQPGDERVITSLTTLLDDQPTSREPLASNLRLHISLGQEQDEHVRMAIMITLVQVAQIGDERAISSMIARLGDPDANVRCIAVKSLPEVAEKGDERAIAALKECLDDDAYQVRGAVANSLVKLGVS